MTLLKVSDVAHGPLNKTWAINAYKQNYHDIRLVTGRCFHWLGRVRPDWLSCSVCGRTGWDRFHKGVQLLFSTVCSDHVMSIRLLSSWHIWRKIIYKKILQVHQNFHFYSISIYIVGCKNPKLHFFYHQHRGTLLGTRLPTYPPARYFHQFNNQIFHLKNLVKK